MVLNNIVANALNKLNTFERLGRTQVVLQPTSKVMIQLLEILKEEGFIGSYTVENNTKGGHITVNLIGRINKCAAISPNFPIKVVHFEKRERQFLPSKGFGVLILTTPKGIMKHKIALEKKIGGKLLAFCY